MPNIRFTLKRFLVPAGLFFLCFSVNLSVRAQGDLMVFPKRIVFDGNVKANELNLANIGKDTARFDISFKQYRLNEDGSFTEIQTPDAGQNFADKYLRYYPRSIILGPKESQVVKVQLTKSSTMAPGEYRSHIYIRAVPNVKPLGEEEKKDTTKFSIRLIPIFGISIPAIIRIGESDTKVTMSDLSFSVMNDTIPVVQVKLNRTGNMSAFGDLNVTYHAASGKTTQVGRANGIAVYTPNAARRFQLSLQRIPGVDYHSGSLHVEYLAPSDAKPVKYAEADLQLK